ncbi:MAG: hypothetical protein JSU74_01900, partial [Candidatus Zixiibacteriota bacterium]
EASGSLTADDPYDFQNYDADGEMAVNAKYKPVSNISLEATFNPDFSQIEPDAAQVDVNSSSVLAFPERRPFFQEARQLFYTWRFAYYSRMINDPKVAFKASGKIGKTSFGYLSAYDEHSPFILPFEDASVYVLGKESYSNVLRWLHTVGEDSYIGLLATDRRFEGGGSGTMMNFDGQWRMHENYRLQVQAMASHINEPDDPELNEQISPYIERGWVDSTFGDEGYTALFDGESFNGYYWIINLEERARHLNFDIGYLEAGPTYRSDLGFQRDGNWRSVETFGCYIIYFDNGWLEKLEPNFSITNRWNFDGQKKYRGGEFGLIADLRGQLILSADYSTHSESFRGIEFDNLWSIYGRASKSFSEQLYLRVSGDYGRQVSRSYLVTGKQTSLNLYAYIRPSDRLQIEPDYNYIKSVNTSDNSILYEGYIFRTKAYYYFSRKFNIRLVAQYNDIYETLNIDPLVTYRINPFTVFYLGTSYEYCEMTGTENGFEEDNVYLNQRQFFVKLQYLFQI